LPIAAEPFDMLTARQG